jgi:hypothetical protein
MKIINIKRGTGDRSKFIYAQLVDDNDNLIISATLNYIIARLNDGSLI